MAAKNGTQLWLAEAIQHHQAGRLVEAEILYKRVLDADPGSADALHLLGVIAEQTGQASVALQFIDEALRIAPENGHYHYSRGLALQRSDNPAAAIAAYRKSLEHNPEHIKAMENLAVALVDIGDNDQGETVCRKVLQLSPDSPIARRNLGTLLIGHGRRERALEHFDRVLSLNPADASARSKRYQTLLGLGRFQEGYEDYAWRHHSAEFSGPSPAKLLPLPSLGDRKCDGRKLLILPEQGIGDEILFACGLPRVLARASSVLLFADPRLLPLFGRSFPTLDVRPALPAYQCSWPKGIDETWLRCEAGELPRMAFGDAYPEPAAYLHADPQRIRYWRDRLSDLPGRHIGIAWRGGADTRARQARSMSLMDLVPLMHGINASFVNMQYAAHDHDLAAEIHDFNAARGQADRLIELEGLDTKNDLDEMAALSLALDCVVTIDSAIAHLAAAVGAKTCVLLPPNHDWRWFDGRSDSPWFVNATLWRRPANENWTSAIQALLEWLIADESAAPANIESTDRKLASVRTTARDAGKVDAAKESGTVLLLNDTSAWYHWGCSCTSIALNEGLRAANDSVISWALLQDLRREDLPRSVDELSSSSLFRRFRRSNAKLIDAMEHADRIVINGEGSLHGSGEQAMALLYLAWIGTNRIRCPVHIVNHSVYPIDGNTAAEDVVVAMYRTVYESVQRPVVREAASYAVLDAMGIPSTLGFDCLPLFAQRHGPDIEDVRGVEKRVVIAGSVIMTSERVALFAELAEILHQSGYRLSMLLGARGYPAADDSHFAAALHSAARGMVDIVLATSEFDWLRHIRDASLLISGRFHHSIAAACMRTPFTVIGSNTPKIIGLMAVLSELAASPDSFRVIEEHRDALKAAVTERISDPSAYVLGDSELQQLRDMASASFSCAN